MKQTLIKLSKEHYIIIDDSEINVGDYVFESLNKVIFKLNADGNDYSNSTFKKITHSTKPLQEYCRCRYGSMMSFGHPCRKECQHPVISSVKELSLSEIEEIINGYNVEFVNNKIK